MGRQQEEARAMSPAPTATIKIDGWWNHPERHGAMFDLAASEDVKLREGEVKVIPLGIRMKLPEGYFGLVVPRSSTCIKHGIMMANSVGIIESDYCGDNDVWGFVAYATRGTKIPKGTRIAQFMPVRMFGDLDFDVVDSMPYADRGGYGSTGEMSAEGHTAEGRTFRDANGLELHVGDYVIDEFGECFCVMGLNDEDGATAAYADLGNSRTSLECAPCLSLRLDERPHDCDGMPIEVGEVVYYCDKESGEPKAGFGPFRVIDYDPHAQAVLLRYEKGGVDGYGNYSESFESCELLTHRKPDSWEKLEEDAKMVKACDYAHAPRDEYGITVCRDCRFQKSKSCRQEMILDMMARAKKLAGIEEQEGGKRTAIAGNEEER